MRLPLRTQLAALYALVLGVVLVGFSIVLVRSVHSALSSTLDQELAVRATAIAAVLEPEPHGWVIDPKSGLAESYAKDPSLYFVVTDQEHKLLLQSTYAPPRAAQRSVRDHSQEFTVAGRHWQERVLACTKPADEEEKTGPVHLIVACGKDLESIDVSLASLKRELWLLGPLVLVVALAAGYWLAGRALRPVAEITEIASEIGASHLDRRLPVGVEDELGRLALTLNTMFDRLQAGFEARMRFTADASHELRTPLAIIVGNVELGLKRERTASEHREFLQEIAGAAQRMRHTVESLLTLARADAHALIVEHEVVPVAALIGEAIHGLEQLAAQRSVTLATNIGTGVGTEVVRGDRERLRELVTILVSNAIQYNRTGGSVTISAEQLGERVRLSICDTGIGIAAEQLPFVFDRFFRADPARSRSDGGVGLGLAIAKSIVEAHGGAIRVVSQLGVGSTFVVEL